jgi:pyruvate kinase
MKLNKKTKIVATIGPVSSNEKTLTKMAKAGLNIIRMNFSHGDFAEHQEKVDNGRKVSKETGIPLAFLQDLGGPKIRTGEFDTESGRVKIKKGQTFTFTTREVKGDETICSVSYKKLPQEIKVGHTIMVDDGKKRMVVKQIKGQDIICKVVVGGELKGRRGINLPDTDVSISSLTPKDKADLKFGLKNKVDFFALSFVRRPSDVLELRRILDKAGSKAAIISKIEVMYRVATRTENDYLHEQLLSSVDRVDHQNVDGSIAASAIKTAHRIDAKLLISLTNSGYTARLLSRHRSQLPVLTFTPNEDTYQKSILNFGCWVYKMNKYTDFAHAIKDIKTAIKKENLAKKGDKIVIVGARPFGKRVETNMMVVETV